MVAFGRASLSLTPPFKSGQSAHVQRFGDIKQGFRQILSDPYWFPKLLFGGCLLINPMLIILAPFAHGHPDSRAHQLLLVFLGVNLLTFWLPLGFTFEVLRRARTGHGAQLPDWKPERWPRYAKEGAVKFLLSITTLIIPAVLWEALAFVVYSRGLGLPPAMTMKGLGDIALLFVIPFCGVACCRWLDGAGIWNSAFNYTENFRLFRKAWPDYLIASAFLVGFNTITMSFVYTIPLAVLFGLCVMDTWLGPIYAGTTTLPSPESAQPRS